MLEVEIASLLEKRAKERVPVGETQKGYYSCYFLIPKKDRGVTPDIGPVYSKQALNKVQILSTHSSHSLDL